MNHRLPQIAFNAACSWKAGLIFDRNCSYPFRCCHCSFASRRTPSPASFSSSVACSEPTNRQDERSAHITTLHDVWPFGCEKRWNAWNLNQRIDRIAACASSTGLTRRPQAFCLSLRVVKPVSCFGVSSMQASWCVIMSSAALGCCRVISAKLVLSFAVALPCMWLLRRECRRGHRWRFSVML